MREKSEHMRKLRMVKKDDTSDLETTVPLEPEEVNWKVLILFAPFIPYPPLCLAVSNHTRCSSVSRPTKTVKPESMLAKF